MNETLLFIKFIIFRFCKNRKISQILIKFNKIKYLDYINTCS